MTENGFEASVTRSGNGPVIKLSGTVNRAAKDGLEAAYDEAAQGDGEILLDFGNVEYINSTGIAIIVGVLARARADSREVGATGLSDHYREVFEITRLSQFMKIHDNEPAES